VEGDVENQFRKGSELENCKQAIITTLSSLHIFKLGDAYTQKISGIKLNE
jgi:hypothetical protein